MRLPPALGFVTPATLFAISLASNLATTSCASGSDSAPDRVVVDQPIDIKVAGSPLLTFHVQSLDTSAGQRLGVFAHNTGSRTINSATYVLRLHDHEAARGIVFEYMGMIGALATGSKSQLVKLDTGVVFSGTDSLATDQSDLLQVIRVDATSFVGSNPFAGLYHGTLTAPGAAPMSMSGTVAFDGQTYFSIDGGLNVGGGASVIRGTLESTGHFAGSAIRSDSLAVAVVANGASALPLASTADGKLAGTLNVIAAEGPPFAIVLDLDRRTQ
jgi:hypothetical protein